MQRGMKTSRIFTLCVAAAFCMTGCGSLDGLILREQESVVSEENPSPIKRFDVDALESLIEETQSIWTQPDRETEILSAIDDLMTAVDEAYTIKAYAEADYYADWTDRWMYENYSDAQSDYYAVDAMVTWAIVHGYKKSVYSELFAPYVQEDWIDYCLINSLSRVVKRARSNAAEYGELLDEYYDTAYSDDMESDEMNLTCAQLYLDTLGTWDLTNCMFDTYCRDYTVEQALDAYEAALTYLAPVTNALMTSIEDNSKTTDILRDDYDAMQLLTEYAPKLSPQIGAASDKLVTDSLCRIATGEDCYTGSYTTPLPLEHSSLIYAYLSGSFHDWITISHEFGHFYADLKETTPIYLQENTTDIAEVHSQGMEMMFTTLYADMFGENAALLERTVLCNLLDSVLSGLVVGAFECEVMQKYDQIEPEEVVALFDDYNAQYDLGLQLYEISHLYEQPGYYISYGVSALAALQIYVMTITDQAAALETFERFCDLSSTSGEYQFCEALSVCGMEDIFSRDTIENLADVLNERIAEIS